MAAVGEEFSVKLLINVAGKTVLRFIDRSTLLEELKLKLAPTSENIVSFTYEYSDTNVSLENEDDMKAFLDLAFIETITTFKVTAIIKGNPTKEDEPKRKKPKTDEERAELTNKELRRREAYALLVQQRAAQGVVVKRGRPVGSKNKPKEVVAEPRSDSGEEEDGETDD